MCEAAEEVAGAAASPSVGGTRARLRQRAASGRCAIVRGRCRLTPARNNIAWIKIGGPLCLSRAPPRSNAAASPASRTPPRARARRAGRGRHSRRRRSAPPGPCGATPRVPFVPLPPSPGGPLRPRHPRGELLPRPLQLRQPRLHVTLAQPRRRAPPRRRPRLRLLRPTPRPLLPLLPRVHSEPFLLEQRVQPVWDRVRDRESSERSDTGALTARRFKSPRTLVVVVAQSHLLPLLPVLENGEHRLPPADEVHLHVLVPVDACGQERGRGGGGVHHERTTRRDATRRRGPGGARTVRLHQERLQLREAVQGSAGARLDEPPDAREVGGRRRGNSGQDQEEEEGSQRVRHGSGCVVCWVPLPGFWFWVWVLGFGGCCFSLGFEI